MGLGLAVTEDDTVHHELAIVGGVAEVTAVCEVACAILLVVVHGLVYPVPDSTTAEEVGALDSLPVVDEVTYGITHRVGILRDVEGVLDAILTGHGTLCPTD